MSMQANSGTARPNPEHKPAKRDWTATFAVMTLLVFGLGALAVVKANGGSITATAPCGEIAVTVLAPQ